ncbi:hypothetical protein HZB88_03395 [archaeon]|nr:hypothetical protein [archaeon]
MNHRVLDYILIVICLILIISIVFTVKNFSEKGGEFFEAEKIIIDNVKECEQRWYECKSFCKKPENLKKCQVFCKENLNLCELLPKDNLTAEFVPKPNTTLNFYKGIIINLYPGVYPNYPLSLMIVDAKNLHANIVDIWVDVGRYAGEQSSFEYQVQRRAKLVELAHKNGLQVSLRLVCPNKTTSSLELATCLAEDAKIARQLDVYQVIAFGEIDSWLGKEEIQEYASKILEEIRKNYNGRVGIGFCCAVYEYDYNLFGYDFLLRSVYSRPDKDLDIWMFNMSGDQINLYDNINAVRQLANNSGIKEVVVGETGVCDPSKKDPEGRDECWYMNTTHVTSKEEAKYYENFFGRTHNLVQGYFIFYIFPVMNIKDEPAEAVVQEWYGKLPS